MTRVLRWPAIGVLLLLAATTAATAPASASPARIRLAVHVDDGNGTVRDWKLSCNPSTGSTHPNTKAACALLNRSGVRVLAPVPRDVACSMIYGGPQRATISGTWGAKRIAARFNRTNGCEVARWQRLLVVLVLPRPASTSTVTGRVSLGPTCPVQQAGQTCEQPSVDAVVRFTNGSETVTAQATVAAGFRVSLPSGAWTATANVGMRCPLVPVRVPASQAVVIACDTGIR